MKTELVFKDWQKAGKSVYNTKEGVELASGPFHSGTCFKCEIQLNPDEEAELRSAIEAGYEPIFEVWEETKNDKSELQRDAKMQKSGYVPGGK